VGDGVVLSAGRENAMIATTKKNLFCHVNYHPDNFG
jgi:hypothetical protein